jgi:pre-mRNA branch site protein p14
MIYLANMVQSDKSESKLIIFKKKLINFRGTSGHTKGTAFVCYDDIYDAKNAVDHLSGFNVAGRYY